MKQHAARRRGPAAGADRQRQGRLAVRLRWPALPGRHQLLVGQPLRPLQSAHQCRAARAARELEHVILAGFTHRPVVELSERLSALTGGALGHCFYASDGASATEIALKMSFHSWQNRGRLATSRNSSAWPAAITARPSARWRSPTSRLFKDAYAPLIRPASTVPTPDARLAEAGRNPVDVARRAAAALERHLEQHHRAHRRADRRAADPVRQRHGDVRSGIPAPGPRLCDRYRCI
jgi:4-aminobutyrate aminotransferase-like enzyme